MATMYYGALTIGMGVSGEQGITVVPSVCKEPVIKEDSLKIDMGDRVCFHKLGRLIYKILRGAFVCVIYYYAPFIVVLYPFFTFYPFKTVDNPRSDILLDEQCKTGTEGSWYTVTSTCYFAAEVSIVGNLPFSIWGLFKF